MTTYTINLGNDYTGKQSETVASIEDAQTVLRKCVMDEGFGASDCHKGFGNLKEGNRIIGRVAYNGKWFPESR